MIVVGLAASVLAQTASPKFESSRAWEHLRQMVGIGPRPAGSAALEQTRKYITSQRSVTNVLVRSCGQWRAVSQHSTIVAER